MEEEKREEVEGGSGGVGGVGGVGGWCGGLDGGRDVTEELYGGVWELSGTREVPLWGEEESSGLLMLIAPSGDRGGENVRGLYLLCFLFVLCFVLFVFLVLFLFVCFFLNKACFVN